MPIRSKAQQRAMYAAASGSGKAGIPKSVAKKYIEETPKSAYGNLPKKKVALRRKY